jgi:hypothetical protein
MKKLFFLSILAISVTANSQNTFPTNGNAGIGTLTPTEELEVLGTVKAEQANFNKTWPNGSTFINVNDMLDKTKLLGLGVDASGSSLFSFFDMPQSSFYSKSQIFFNIDDRNDMARLRFVAQANGTTSYDIFNKSQQSIYNLHESNDNVYIKMPKENTYLTIGTSSYNDNGELYKLTVNGKVRAHAVKVYTDWADFVFNDNYYLPSLKEVEKYIIANGHLKDVPSASEVEKNGIELGEMNKILLQKIEELTLYAIELKKEIDSLKSKMD